MSLADYWRCRQDILRRCESPIERLMTEALGEWESLEGGLHLVEADDIDGLMAAREFFREPVISPQVALHGYRVDFLAMVDAPTGTMIVVECDGHQFHERTAAQAERDRRRDRNLLERGVPTLRFTGREIARDASECADSIRGFVGQKWLDVAWAAYQEEMRAA
jgi:very-short-patch-repair endonuclease